MVISLTRSQVRAIGEQLSHFHGWQQLQNPPPLCILRYILLTPYSTLSKRPPGDNICFGVDADDDSVRG